MQGIKVIIADDHPIFRQGLHNLLEKMPTISKIREVSDGKAVMALLEKEKFDIVFMDIRMPEMDGIETTRLLKQKFSNVKVIALTMMDDRNRIVGMFKNGASGYLLKHSDESEIESAIKKVMRGEKYYGREVSELLLDKIFDQHNFQKRGPINSELSARECEIIQLICHSYTSKKIGLLLNIAEKTVESHRIHIYEKLEINKLVDLIYYAIDKGIITRDGMNPKN